MMDNDVDIRPSLGEILNGYERQNYKPETAIAEFVDKLHKMRRTYSTEDFLYMDKDKFTEKDIYNEDYIGDCIFDLFDEIGKQQEKEAIEDDSWSFSDTEWYFKFNNKMYFICRLIGQGTEYIVRTASNEEKNYLDLDLYFENK